MLWWSSCLQEKLIFQNIQAKHPRTIKLYSGPESEVPSSPCFPDLGLEAILSKVQIPEDFIECEVDGYSNCFEFIKTLELGCPESRLSDENTDSPDECRDEADQFLTTFTWTCPTRSGLLSAPNLYMVELRTRVPSDDQGWSSFVLVQSFCILMSSEMEFLILVYSRPEG